MVSTMEKNKSGKKYRNCLFPKPIMSRNLLGTKAKKISNT